MQTGLIRARFLRRYQRFLADVVLDGRTVTVHVPNTGSMATLLPEPGEERDCWLAPATTPGRKLPYTLVLLGLADQGLALVDTSLPNRLVEEGIVAQRIPELAGYQTLRREVAYGQASRIDLLLDDPSKGTCHIEVKNVTMAGARPGRADFPDAVTARGRKHLEELTALARAGQRAVQFFLVSRTDCTRAGLAAHIDPMYAEALRMAQEAGVEVIAYRATISSGSITVGSACAFSSLS